MGWTFGNSSVHSSPVRAGRDKHHRWVSSKSYPIFTSHFHIRTWHKILKEWATTNRINNGIMQDPAKMKVLILFGCSNMYCGKLWNIKHLSKHLVAAFNMFVSDYAEHLLFMILWEDLHCSWPSYKLYFCKQSAPTKDTQQATALAPDTFSLGFCGTSEEEKLLAASCKDLWVEGRYRK